MNMLIDLKNTHLLLSDIQNIEYYSMDLSNMLIEQNRIQDSKMHIMRLLSRML